jgi:hypothetical protein
MSAQFFVGALVAALGQEVHVQLAQNWREAIGIVQLDLAVRGLQAQAVRKRLLALPERPGEEAFLVDPRQLPDHVAGSRVHHRGPARLRQKGAYDECAPSGVHVHAEE